MRKTMTRLMAAAAAISVLAISTSAFAADGVSLSTVSGGVLVNQGQGFKPAKPGMNLRAGDRVIVTSTGRAGINYPGGCGVALGSGSMATISTATPCQTSARNAGIVSSQTQPSATSKAALGKLGPPLGTLKGLGGGGQSSSP
jgi:hypothetical protein